MRDILRLLSLGLLVLGFTFGDPLGGICSKIQAQTRSESSPKSWFGAGQHPSHFLIETEHPGDLDAALKNRLNHAKGVLQFKDVVQQLLDKQKGSLDKLKIDPEEIKRLLRNLPKDTDSLENLLQLAKQATQGNPQGGIDQNTSLQNFLTLLKNLPSLDQSLDVPLQRSHRINRPTDNPSESTFPLGSTPTRTFSKQLEEFLTKNMANAASWLDKNGYNQDGAALKEAMRQLTSMTRQSPPSFLGSGKGVLEGLNRMAKFLSPTTLNFGNLNALTPNLKLNMPSLPDLSFTPPSVPSLSGLGSTSNFAIPDAPPVVVGLAIAFIIGVLVWKLPAWLRDDRRLDPNQSQEQLGPWPVAQDQVRTHGELIQAFEYLSQYCLGSWARTKNHAEIAERLGADRFERKEAARSLARIYEQVRYAPEQAGAEIPLDEKVQVNARHALCFLAGVGTP